MPALVGTGRVVIGGAGSYDPDVTSWLARIKTNGGVVSQNTARAVNLMVQAWKSAGLWSKKLFVMPLCGDFIASRVPLVVGAGSSLVAVTNLTASDYVETGATGGMKGNGTNSFMNLGWNPSTSGTLNSMSLSAYVKGTEAAGTTRAIVGNNDGVGGGITILGWASAGTVEVGSIAVSSGSEYAPPPAEVPPSIEGFLAVGTNGSRSQQYYQNGATVGSAATSSGAFQGVAMYALANNTNGTAASFSTRYLRFVDIATGMSAAQHAANYTIVHSFQTALGRNV